jgi:hypothetical protein
MRKKETKTLHTLSKQNKQTPTWKATSHWTIDILHSLPLLLEETTIR